MSQKDILTVFKFIIYPRHLKKHFMSYSKSVTKYHTNDKKELRAFFIAITLPFSSSKKKRHRIKEKGHGVPFHP